MDDRDKRDDRDGSEVGHQRSCGFWVVWVVMGSYG